MMKNALPTCVIGIERKCTSNDTNQIKPFVNLMAAAGAVKTAQP